MVARRSLGGRVGESDDEESRRELIVDNELEATYDRDPFTSWEAKWLCLVRPVRARETLAHWGLLQIEVFRAQDLHIPKGYVLQTVPNAFVRVLVDDDGFDGNETARQKSADPVWASESPFQCKIYAPRSMIRLEVRDDSGRSSTELLGFVDFCAGDLPLGKEVQGWLELRFAENLSRTSHWRYRRHCRARESEYYTAHGHEQSVEGNGQSADTASEGPSVTSAPSQPPTKHKRMHKAKVRANSVFAGCCGNPQGGVGLKDNGGELLVKLLLKRAPSVGFFSSQFATPIPPPPAKDFGISLIEEDQQKIDLQQVTDVGMYIKASLWDQTFNCVLNYVKYIIFWRNFFVSAIITIAFAFTCYFTWLFLAVVPGFAALAMIFNAIAPIRTKMITNGSNAPLDDEGFMQVCAMKSTSEVQSFLQRVIRFKLFEAVPKVKDRSKLQILASRCFRQGKPLKGLTFDRLREHLRKVDWIEKSAETIRKDSNVLVREKLRGKVIDVLPPDEGGSKRVLVELVSHEQNLDLVPPEKKVFNFDEVVVQTVLPRIPIWSIPTQLAMIYFRAQAVSYDVRSKLIPIVFYLRDIAIWRSWVKASIITLLLAATSAIGIWLAVHVDEYEDPSCETTKTTEHSSSAEKEKAALITGAWSLVQELDNIFFLLVGLCILLPNAPWFRFFSSLGKILFSGCPRKQAPKKWKFYRPEDEQQTEQPTEAARE